MSGKASSARAERLRVARGPRRPVYLGDPDLDRVMMMLLALAAEVSVLRERIDTHERLADAGMPAGQAAVEGFHPAAEVEGGRTELREAMLRRVLRVLFEEMELADRAEQKAVETTQGDAG